MKTTELKKFVNSENIECLLFLNDANEPTVRVRDLDAEQNYSLVKYPTLAMAEKAYKSAIEGDVEQEDEDDDSDYAERCQDVYNERNSYAIRQGEMIERFRNEY
jgi:hypothetical protein